MNRNSIHKTKTNLLGFAFIFLFISSSFLFPRLVKAENNICACYTKNKDCTFAYLPEGSKSESACTNACIKAHKDQLEKAEFGKDDLETNTIYLQCSLAMDNWISEQNKKAIAASEAAKKKTGTSGATEEKTITKEVVTKATRLLVKPKLNVEIPGFSFSKMALTGGGVSGIIDYAKEPISTSEFVESTFIADYVTGVYRFLIGASTIIAIIMIMIGGLQYVIAAGGGDVGKAKERIKNAIIGLVLLLSVYTILYTVNPQLVLLKPIRLETIQSHALSELASEGQSIYSKGQECLFDVYGNSAENVQKQLKTIEILGHKYAVHEKAFAAFQAVATKVNSNPYRVKKDGGSGGFAWRANVNATQKRSMHSFGLAIDIYPKGNPNYKRVKNEPCKTEIPIEIINAFKSEGFKWGGDYKTVCDAMHFEWYGECLKGASGWSGPTKSLCCVLKVGGVEVKQSTDSVKSCTAIGGNTYKEACPKDTTDSSGKQLQQKFCCEIPNGFGTKKQTVANSYECTGLNGKIKQSGPC